MRQIRVENDTPSDAELASSFISYLARASMELELTFANEFPGLTIQSQLDPISSFMGSIPLPTISLQPSSKRVSF